MLALNIVSMRNPLPTAPGNEGLVLAAGKEYEGYFFAKATKAAGMTVMLRNYETQVCCQPKTLIAGVTKMISGATMTSTTAWYVFENLKTVRVHRWCISVVAVADCSWLDAVASFRICRLENVQLHHHSQRRDHLQGHCPRF